MWTKVRTTALALSVFMLGICAGALVMMSAIVPNVDWAGDPAIGVILVTGLVGIVSGTVGYLGGAMSRLTDDSGPPPWVGLLEKMISKINS